MATAVLMPRQGQTVESCIIASWKKNIGDTVSAGDVLCEVETDKALVEVESPADGILLAQFFAVGDDVPVMTTIAAIGEAGEDVSALAPGGSAATQTAPPVSGDASSPQTETAPAPPAHDKGDTTALRASPRARQLAGQRGVDLAPITGTGPRGRIIERDVIAALSRQPRLTPLARAMVESGEFTPPDGGSGSGIRGQITKRDLLPAAESAVPASLPPSDEVTAIPLRGPRRVIAERMLNSLQTTAQLTLNAYADARALRAFRQRLKISDEALGLQKVTINDLVHYAVVRALQQHADLNATLESETIYQHRRVHLGFAVDTPRGLIVPVIRDAQTLSLKQLAERAAALAAAAQTGKIAPDDLSGGTFTVSNLGSFGIENFTPVLNPPQVAILGVGNISLKPVETASGDVEFIPHLGLSLTVDHRAVDGAPGARFLQTLVRLIAQYDLLWAL
ncbi:2-oxo acid dehydrogenase subunit E2 [Anaerolineae bacterium CFX9]|nr:2-oxo acid dehydrogenase subunit E2 [Anaerolineae bacterium CFX9]